MDEYERVKRTLECRGRIHSSIQVVQSQPRRGIEEVDSVTGDDVVREVTDTSASAVHRADMTRRSVAWRERGQAAKTVKPA